MSFYGTKIHNEISCKDFGLDLGEWHIIREQIKSNITLGINTNSFPHIIISDVLYAIPLFFLTKILRKHITFKQCFQMYINTLESHSVKTLGEITYQDCITEHGADIPYRLEIYHLSTNVVDFENCIATFQNHTGMHKYNNKLLEATLTIARGHRVKCYVSKDKRCMYCITNKVYPGLLLKLLSILPVAYNLTNTLNELGIPTDAFRLIGTSNFTEWRECIRQWVYHNKRLFKKDMYLQKLKHVFEGRTERQINVINDRIRRLTKEEERALRNFEDILRQKQNQQMELRAYLTQDNLQHTEFYNYVIENKPEIQDIKIHTEDTIEFEVLVPLDNYDIDTITKLMETPRKNYTNRDALTYKLYELIFIKQEFTYWCSVNFVWDISVNSIHYKRPDRVPKYGGANPHLLICNCWGGNASHIVRALSKADYIFALEQSLAACRNINFLDGSVSEVLTDYVINSRENGDTIFYRKPKIIRHNQTNEWYTAAEFMELLKNNYMDQEV